MARGRMLSVDVAADSELNQLSMEAELLYLRAIPHLDRDGLITGHPILLWATVAPLRAALMDKAKALMDEWVQQDLVMRFDGPDGDVLFFRGFRRHQANMPYRKETPSKFPPPPGWTRCPDGLIPNDDDARIRLAAKFDDRSAYSRALLGFSRGLPDYFRKSSGSGLDEDQDQAEVKDQDQVEVEGQDQVEVEDQQHVVAGAGEKSSPPTPVVQESNTRTRARLSETLGAEHLTERSGPDSGQTLNRASVLEAWAAMMIDSLWGVGVWNDVGHYLSRLPDDELENLSRWLWKCNWLDSWFNAPKSPVGVGLIRKMVAEGQGAGLPTGQLQLMEDEIAAFADPSTLFVHEVGAQRQHEVDASRHGDSPNAERHEHEIDY